LCGRDTCPTQSSKLIRDAVAGQFPEAVNLASVDSRVPFEEVFAGGSGNLLVARVWVTLLNLISPAGWNFRAGFQIPKLLWCWGMTITVLCVLALIVWLWALSQRCSRELIRSGKSGGLSHSKDE
jgi:hypothetical protein